MLRGHRHARNMLVKKSMSGMENSNATILELRILIKMIDNHEQIFLQVNALMSS